MDTRTKWPAVFGLVLGTILLTRSLPTTFAFDKPIHASILTLTLCAGSIMTLSRLLPREGGGAHGRSHQGGQYNAVPLHDIGESHGSREASPLRTAGEDVRYPSSLRKLRILFLILICAVCARIELSRRILADVQCATASWEPFIPLAFAIWDYFRNQRDRRQAVGHDDPNLGVFDAMEESWNNSPYRLLITTSLLVSGSVLALNMATYPSSTWICAASLPHNWMVPAMQKVTVVLDIGIIVLVAQLMTQQEGRGQRGFSLRLASVGWALLFTAAVFVIYGLCYYYGSDPPERTWVLYMPGQWVWSTIKLAALVSCTAICILFCIHHMGVFTTLVTLEFVAVASLATPQSWSTRHPFPPTYHGMAFGGLCLAILGFLAYINFEATSRSGSAKPADSYLDTGAATASRVPISIYSCLVVLFLTHTTIWFLHSRTVTYHPIDLLIYEAGARHEAYLNQTSRSQSLSQATEEYQRRYLRNPPPNFDKWYEYATARNSVVIDGFDSIHRDLEPFWLVAPDKIRERTWELIANPWHDVGGLKIRDGKVEVVEGIVPTHFWMMNGLVEMIGSFSEHLPDMDLAFNLNDEPRVAVPYGNLQKLLEIPQAASIGHNGFSLNRAPGWREISEGHKTDVRVLKELSWQKTFHRFGSVNCAPSSPARTSRHWEVGTLCLACTAPHSLGAFLSNWSTAANICHQPDLADLHGIYLSPAAFKGTHDLYPVFSQSKVHGFQDILYPSAWNWLGKAKYDPSAENPDPDWNDKDSILFWRGATSEGVSSGHGQWRGMTRQRFVHMANSPNNSSPAQNLLLPVGQTDTGRDTLSYHSRPSSELSKLLATDIHVVDSIARCAGADCPDQANEFAPLVPPTDFQSHWRHRYLLDLDGAAFSGRFIPFLHSKSLPFKASLFREWWDDRLTAWWHFVPLDIRGQGFWATLAYFAGVEGIVGGKVVKVEAHGREGERLAKQGREWAGKVLRREDMEVYFFRLLLEWGRLTDEGRDGVGFRVGEG